MKKIREGEEAKRGGRKKEEGGSRRRGRNRRRTISAENMKKSRQNSKRSTCGKELLTKQIMMKINEYENRIKNQNYNEKDDEMKRSEMKKYDEKDGNKNDNKQIKTRW